ncbi:MAG: sodium:solute symporter [Bacteroidota bacterium]
MSNIDWLVLIGTLLFIVLYGVWKTRNISSVESYLLGDRDLKWWTIGLSVMATQASAITFLSTPGQAYEDGMRFAQFYIGLPVAMVILCIFVLPIYYRLKVYTAYEYLEGRFDLQTRTLAAILFLIGRGLAAGITIYAPAIILSTILGWNLSLTIILIGAVVIMYTVLGGTKAVSQTQEQQMIVILSGLVIAFFILLSQLPANVHLSDALGVAGKMGKLKVIDFNFDWSNRYNFWSGMLGGTFLFLSYFGTDQSQVQRYLSGKSLTESRLGLLFNGIFKVPMQFGVLFVGLMVFVFFLFEQPPVHFNQANLEQLRGTAYEAPLEALKVQSTTVFEQKRSAIDALIQSMRAEDQAAISQAQLRVKTLHDQDLQIRESVRELIEQHDPQLETKDDDYVFISFVINYLPVGMVGLLLAVIFSAAMSSTASELNALATTSVIDIYRRSLAPDRSDRHYLNVSKIMTILWGLLALAFAAFASLFDNLIEAVNIVGSVFYPIILGIFMVAFFLKSVGGRAVFIGALLGQVSVVTLYFLDHNEYINLAYLWLNIIGCFIVMILSVIFQQLLPEEPLEDPT